MNPDWQEMTLLQRQPWEQVAIFLEDNSIAVKMSNGHQQHLITEFFNNPARARERRDEMVIIVCSKGFSVVIGW